MSRWESYVWPGVVQDKYVGHSCPTLGLSLTDVPREIPDVLVKCSCPEQIAAQAEGGWLNVASDCRIGTLPIDSLSLLPRIRSSFPGTIRRPDSMIQ